MLTQSAVLAFCHQIMLTQQTIEPTTYSIQPPLKKYQRCDALCWTCGNADVFRCKWVSDGEKVWSKAIERMPSYNYKLPIFLVTQCSQYVPEKEELQSLKSLNKRVVVKFTIEPIPKIAKEVFV